MVKPVPAVVVMPGEWRIARPPVVLSVVGLGSCVCVIAYDAQIGVGGLAHIVLPDSDESLINRDSPRFANVGLLQMIGELAELGARPPHLQVHLVGGARMIDAAAPAQAIGPRNVAAVKTFLGTLSVTIASEDTGGVHARAVWFDVGTGAVRVKGPPRAG